MKDLSKEQVRRNKRIVIYIITIPIVYFTILISSQIDKPQFNNQEKSKTEKAKYFSRL